MEYPTSENLAEAGFADAWRTIYPDEMKKPGVTWSPLTKSEDHHDRIDFVYSRGKDIDLLDVKIIVENRENADIVVTPYPSDHRAVVATYATPHQRDGKVAQISRGTLTIRLWANNRSRIVNRHRNARACEDFLRRAHRCKLLRSSSASISSGISLFQILPPVFTCIPTNNGLHHGVRFQRCGINANLSARNQLAIAHHLEHEGENLFGDFDSPTNTYLGQ